MKHIKRAIAADLRYCCIVCIANAPRHCSTCHPEAMGRVLYSDSHVVVRHPPTEVDKPVAY